MISQTPLPNQEALNSLLQREVVASDLSSADWRAVSATIRQESFFSARTLLEDYLATAKDTIAGLLNPGTEQRADRITPENPEGNVTTGQSDAYARAQLRELLGKLNYAPAPEDSGTIKDLSSDQRIDLVLTTNKQLAQGQGNWLQSQRTGVLDSFPADELFRLENRVKKRDWLYRFRLAGEQTGDPIGTGWTITPDGRMIALKNHAIWHWIGSSELFSDALDVIWPPFAFNSGMWVRDVSRRVCEQIGLLQKGQAAPKPANILSALKLFAEKISALAGAREEVPA